MPDVAIVRGQWVTESELSNYRFDDYDATVIGTGGKDYKGDHKYTELLSVASLPGLAELAGRGIVGFLKGSDSYLYGLVDELADYDIVHIAETYHGFSDQAISAKRKHDCAVVCTVWENIPYLAEDSHYSRGPLQQVVRSESSRIKDRVRSDVDAFLAVTKQVAFTLETEGVDPSKIHHVPIGVDIEQFYPGVLENVSHTPVDLGLTDGGTLDVLYLGRYTWSKGIYDLVAAWKSVVDQIDIPAQLTFIGPGNERERVQQFAETAGVSDCTFRGPVPHEQVPYLLDAADVLVLPSLPTKYWQEQYGRVLLEAQATETAVVASKTGGIPEASGGIAEYVNPGDAQDIARGLNAVLEDDEYRRQLAQKGRDRIKDGYTIEDTAAAVEGIYDEVLDRRLDY